MRRQHSAQKYQIIRKVWSALLQKKLTEKCPLLNFEVINGGVDGYKIRSSYLNLKHRVLQLGPDIVLLYHAINDIVATSRRIATEHGVIKEKEKIVGVPFMQTLISRSLLCDLIYKNLAILIKGKQNTNSRKIRDINLGDSNSFIASLDSIRKECQQLKIPLILFTFSTKYRANQSTDELGKNIAHQKYYLPFMTSKQILRAVRLFNNAIIDYALTNQNVYVDTLHNLIPADDKHFADSIHFTDYGAEKNG